MDVSYKLQILSKQVFVLNLTIILSPPPPPSLSNVPISRKILPARQEYDIQYAY